MCGVLEGGSGAGLDAGAAAVRAPILVENAPPKAMAPEFWRRPGGNGPGVSGSMNFIFKTPNVLIRHRRPARIIASLSGNLLRS
jgi:hypothetical protein